VAESEAIDEFPLEQIGRVHGIAAGLFVPFVIHRLTRTGGELWCDLDVELIDIGGVAQTKHRLRIAWQAKSVLARPPGVQDNVVTEWAALGIAAAVVWQYAGLRIDEVAEPGAGFDFWVSDGSVDVGLEVSGTLTDDIETRQREKVRQLFGNPEVTSGYVVVVGFARNRVTVSFHRRAEAKP
jgi:hypothetical protein